MSFPRESSDLADVIYQAIQDYSTHSERSLQGRKFQAGVSDLGFCSERLRRMLAQEAPPRETDMLASFIGTAIGEHAERALKKAHPEIIVQAEVKVVYTCDGGEYVLTGHPDVLVPGEGLVIDFKTDYGLTTIARSGPSQQQQFQRHSYAKGAWEGGFFPGHDLAEIRVANAWIDRAAIDKGVLVDIEPYDEGQVTAAGTWLDDVIYAYLQGESARKEPPRDMCAVVCGFFETCRALDTDVTGLITDEPALDAVAMYREGLDLEKRGARLKSQAKQHLVGVSGSTGEFLVRWTHVNETFIAESTRKAHDKLEVRAIPGRKP